MTIRARNSNEVRWNDLRINTGSFQYLGSADPTLVLWTPTGSGNAFSVFAFQKNDIGYAVVQMPHDYKQGSDLYFHLHWTPKDRGVAENAALVGWKVDYSIANVNSNFGIANTLDFSDACDGVDDKHQIISSQTVSGTGLTISHMLLISTYRTDTGADDTWVGTTAAQSPALLEFDIHYQLDDRGSQNETSK